MLARVRHEKVVTVYGADVIDGVAGIWMELVHGRTLDHIVKTDGPLQQKSIAWARWGLLWVALGVLLVSLATPFASETVRDKWFDFPRTLALMVLPASTFFVWLWVWWSLGRSEWKPFAGAVAIYVLAFIGLAYSLFPFVIMDRMTIWEAAAHPSALVFTLVGAGLVLPFIIGYTIYAYSFFQGNVTGADHYER